MSALISNQNIHKFLIKEQAKDEIQTNNEKKEQKTKRIRVSLFKQGPQITYQQRFL